MGRLTVWFSALQERQLQQRPGTDPHRSVWRMMNMKLRVLELFISCSSALPNLKRRCFVRPTSPLNREQLLDHPTMGSSTRRTNQMPEIRSRMSPDRFPSFLQMEEPLVFLEQTL